MGSSGYGEFDNYKADKKGKGDGELVECPDEIKNIKLEDVATSEYFISYNQLPVPGSTVHLRTVTYHGRLAIETLNTHEIIGNLPTKYNRLLFCIEKGKDYYGAVVSSGVSPVPYVVVTLNA